jgi:RNA recognition motif-containing protein
MRIAGGISPRILFKEGFKEFMEKKLYVGNISFKATEEDLKELFSQAGEVQYAKLIKDNATGRLRGFGFVEMSTEAEAEKAVSTLNGKDFMGRNLVVSESRPQQKKGEYSKGY